ncbi:MAG TPA: WecB/TagA/CpsF family glycosyltransferase [Terracidiphilus sp.]|nr:WecB/TagA/CpsF family glycosyltransferase [Terracidiphilus sp.]
MSPLARIQKEAIPRQDASHPTQHERNVISFAGIDFRGAIADDLLPESDRLKLIFPVNAELILLAEKNPRFRQILSRHYSTFDGFWPYFTARLRSRKQIQKLSGSEFSRAIFEHAAQNKLKLFLLGATPQVNLAAQQKVAQEYGIKVDGYAPAFEPYPYSPQTNEGILEEIRRSRPQVLMIAFGAPKQEFWLDEHQSELQAAGVQLAMAVGGTLDMLAGVYQKAPAFICSVGLEGVWRVLLDPKRIKRFPNPVRFFRIAFYH